MTRSHPFTSESVSGGHPDKLADLISDTVLDHVLEQDPRAKVACETLIGNGLVVIAGEFGARPSVSMGDIEGDIPALARSVLRDAGYRADFPGIDPERCEIRLALNQQSPDIHRGVEREDGITGAGDQGLMFGYATDETPERMPWPILLSHRLMQRHAAVRGEGALPWLRPDAKAQVTVRRDALGECTVDTVVLSTQHAPDVRLETLREAVIAEIIEPVIPVQLRGATCRYLVNPTGCFEIGGPCADTGLTGRKIIVDTYGGSCPHGGGAFSGKDPTKVDRSGAYAARHVAVNVVAAGLARRCTVQLAYAIGVSEPVSVLVDLHGTGAVAEDRVAEAVPRVFDLTPAGIIAALDLRRPIYRHTAVHGHFGRPRPEFTWEHPDRAAVLAQACGLKAPADAATGHAPDGHQPRHIVTNIEDPVTMKRVIAGAGGDA